MKPNLPKILFTGQLPPPFHGQAVVNKIVFEADWQGFESIVLPMRYSKSIDEVGSAGVAKILHLILLILKTWKIWLLERPDALYYPPASANKVPIIRDIIYLSLTRFLFKKTIYHFHAGGLADHLKQMGLLGKIALWVYSKPDLSIELYSEESSTGFQFQSKILEIVPNGLFVEKKNPRKLHHSGEPFEIIFLGSLREDKGVLDAIKVLNLLGKKNFNARLKIAGSWASKAFELEVKQFIKKERLTDSVQFVGVIEGEEKRQFYHDADCFLFPTFYYAERFPLVLIEALGAGLPLVTTRWRGIPQLVKGCEAAQLCEVGNIDQLAEAVIQNAENNKSGALSSAARKHYEDHYTLQKFTTNMETALHNIFNEINEERSAK